MRKQILVAVGAIIMALAGGSGAVTVGQSDPPGEPAHGEGQVISNKVMEAWAGEYDEAEIEAIYDPDVVMVLDTDVLAADRDGIRSVIGGAIHIGNTYTQIGPVIEYEDDEGDLYVASIVEVAGMGHPSGDPVIGFYRVRDGRVTRHIFMYAPEY